MISRSLCVSTQSTNIRITHQSEDSPYRKIFHVLGYASSCCNCIITPSGFNCFIHWAARIASDSPSIWMDARARITYNHIPMRHRILISFLIGVVVELYGCTLGPPPPPPEVPVTHPSATTRPSVIEDVWEPTWPAEEVDDWGWLIQHRFGANAVAVYCHGFYAVNGDWLVFPVLLNPPADQDRPWTMEHLIQFEQQAHPGRCIVFLCCNVDHVVLHGHPNVFYAMDDVWIKPDANCDEDHLFLRQFLHPSYIGSVNQLVEAK